MPLFDVYVAVEWSVAKSTEAAPVDLDRVGVR